VLTPRLAADWSGCFYRTPVRLGCAPVSAGHRHFPVTPPSSSGSP